MENFAFGKLEVNMEDFNMNELIEINKKMSKIKKTAQENSKLNRCYYCGKENIPLCNSHSIPRFALKNISSDGELLYSNKLIKLPFEKEEKGIGEAGTFKIICRDCDSCIFKDYENTESYLNTPTPKMLAEIALKNYLKSISKRLIETELYKLGYTFANDTLSKKFLDEKQRVNKLDLNEYRKNYEKAKRISIKNWDNEYYIIFFKKINYTVPIAFQSNLALICDMEGNIINDIYNENENYKIQDLQLCIFPLKDSSIILLFMDSGNVRYRKFNKQFKELLDEEKLEVLNYIMFMYSEDIFLSKKVEKVMLSSKELIELSKLTSDMFTFNNIMPYNEALKKQFSLNNRVKIPNFLSKEFAIK